jgi:small subunit ribosomal protein S11
MAKPAAAAAPATATTAKKKRTKRGSPVGICNIQATFNNTIITISDINGDVVAWGSSGSKGFKGSRKSTPFAAQVAAEDVARRAMDAGMHTVAVLVNGPGSGRESAARAVAAAGMRISMVKDITPIPHNGCRPPKRRRV